MCIKEILHQSNINWLIGIETYIQLCVSSWPKNISSIGNPLELLNAIHAKQLEPIFINVCIALRIFSTIPVSVASAERAFNQLYLLGNVLKTWQRSSMTQERLNSLGVLAIEHRLSSSLDLSDVIIVKFSMIKARKM